MKARITALSILASVALSLVAAGCGGNATTASNPDAAGAETARQGAAAAVAQQPRPKPCGQAHYDSLSGQRDILLGAIYISCIDQPVRVREELVEGLDRGTGQNDRLLPPGDYFDTGFLCNSTEGVKAWWVHLTLADESTASATVVVRRCAPSRAASVNVVAHFNTVDGPRSVVVTTDTGQRLKLVAEENTKIRSLADPRTGRFPPFAPIFIQAV